MKHLLTTFALAASILVGRSGPDAAGDFQHPDFFPILPWSPLHGWDGKARDIEANALGSIAECGFNMAGFVQREDLAECEKLGLSAIVLPRGEGLPEIYQHKWKGLSDAAIEARVQQIIKASGTSPAIAGYFIMDEPGLKDFAALGKAVAAVKKHAPGKLAYINLFPNYATLGAPDTSQLGTSNYMEYLERFIADVKPQVLSYDNYMVQFSDDLQNPAQAASYFLNLQQVREAGARHKLPYLQIVASNQLRPGHSIPTTPNLLLQAYTTLAAGYKGVTWYTYYGRKYAYAPIDDDGWKTETWYSVQAVNRQVRALAPVLARLRSTGVYYTAPAPEKSLPILPGEVIESVVSTTPMMIGEFAGEMNSRWVMLVNLSLARSARFSLQTKGPSTFQQLSTVDGKLRSYEPGKDGFWLPPGQGVLLRRE